MRAERLANVLKPMKPAEQTPAVALKGMRRVVRAAGACECDRNAVPWRLPSETEQQTEQHMQSMDDLFYALLQDMYFAEKEQLKALPKWAQKTSSETLKLAFRDHEDETSEQVGRIEQVFEIMGKDAGGKNPDARISDAMTAIMAEAQRVMDDVDDAAVRDAGLVAAAQAAEHYEIARYATLLGWAEHLGEDDIVDLLSESLEEERHADELLSSIAEGGVNASASERPEAAEV
jgi:ferritin-like metal-binding protein YciE